MISEHTIRNLTDEELINHVEVLNQRGDFVPGYTLDELLKRIREMAYRLSSLED